MKRILLIRFSSIGDIVLTSSTITLLKKENPTAEIHYLCKASFSELVQYNPAISEVHAWTKEKADEILKTLQSLHFDYVIDLQNNLRSALIRFRLARPSAVLDKENWKKWKMVHFHNRTIDIPHIVHRYEDTLAILGIKSQYNTPLSFHFPKTIDRELQTYLAEQNISLTHSRTLAVVLGAQHATKKWILSSLAEALNTLGMPVLLLGGKNETEEASTLLTLLKVPCVNVVGKSSLLLSAALMQKCSAVLAYDTGFMHIAAALGKSIFSIWGGTVPELGFAPYTKDALILENNEAKCRPCDKIGKNTCPKGHFACMKELSAKQVVEEIRKNWG